MLESMFGRDVVAYEICCAAAASYEIVQPTYRSILWLLSTALANAEVAVESANHCGCASGGRIADQLTHPSRGLEL